MPRKSQSLWNRNDIQFARLLAEINAAGLTKAQERDLCESMDISKAELRELLERAEYAFERLKSRPD